MNNDRGMLGLLNKRFPYFYFIFAKIIGLGAKPVFLYYILSLQLDKEASELATIFLLLAGVFVLFSVPVHFQFYKVYFERQSKIVGVRGEINKYIQLLISHIFIVSPVVFVVLFLTLDDIVLTVLMFFMLLSEKSFDEVQRFLQFNKRFVYWSNVFLVRTLLPIVIATLVYVAIKAHIIESFIISTIMLNALVYIISTPLMFKRVVYGSMRIDLVNFKFYIKTFKSFFVTKFTFGLTHSNILNADKWLLSLSNLKMIMSEFMLISQFSNSVVIANNYAFIANRRADLLKRENDLGTLWKDYKVLVGTVFFALCVGVGFLLVISMQYLDLKYLSVISILVIVAAYGIYAVTEPITEFLFWNGRVKYLIFIDFMYFALVFVIGYVVMTGLDYTYIPYVFVGALSLRLLMQLFILNRLTKR